MDHEGKSNITGPPDAPTITPPAMSPDTPPTATTTDLKELITFLHHGNTPIRQRAIEHLVGYSTSHPSIFKAQQLKPIADLKLLVRDYPPISRCALEILINTSTDAEVLAALVGDDAFLHVLLGRIIDEKAPHADLHCMLLANLGKSPALRNLLTLRRPPAPSISSSSLALDQLLDRFVRAPDDDASSKVRASTSSYDYLAYLFADLSEHDEIRAYLTTPQPHDNLIPLSKLAVFTQHPSTIRRRGVASTLKNASFPPTTPEQLLSMHPDGENSGDDAGFRLLPFLLLPLAAGTDAYSADEMLELPEELQLLGAEKEREGDQGILRVLLETLLLLTGSREGRERLREMGAYYVVRECHAALEEVDEEVQEVCDRIVQMLMRDEPAEEEEEQGGGGGVMVVEEVEQGKREERAAGKVDQKVVTEKEVVKTEQTAAEQQPAEQEDSDEDDSITEIF